MYGLNLKSEQFDFALTLLSVILYCINFLSVIFIHSAPLFSDLQHFALVAFAFTFIFIGYIRPFHRFSSLNPHWHTLQAKTVFAFKRRLNALQNNQIDVLLHWCKTSLFIKKKKVFVKIKLPERFIFKNSVLTNGDFIRFL